MWFPAVENVAGELIRRINAETVRLDISMWYLTEHSVSIAIANRFRAGVPVRLVGDRNAIFEIDPKTKAEFYYLANAGVPIRLRFNPTWFPEIDHMKMAIFVGQNVVEFGSANWDTFSIIPFSSTNFNDETAFFTDDPAIVGAFKTQFDRLWNDTTPEPESIFGGPPYLKDWMDACTHEPTGCDFLSVYPAPAPMIIDTARREPDNPTPVDLIWGQGPDFNRRLVTEINLEHNSILFANYRLTVDDVTNALLEKQGSGVPVRLIIEPDEYLNRSWPEFWLTHANYDKLWAAGVQIKQRNHQGNMHMKTLITSSFATNASSNIAAAWQRDNDYFISAAAKPSIYTAVRNRVVAMWNDSSGFVPFKPGPPDAAGLLTPGNGASQVPANASLVWKTAAFATDYDVFMGFSSSSMERVANVKAQLVNNPPSQYFWTPPAPLCAGTRYYWLIHSRTNATPVDPSLFAASALQVFTTAGPNQGCAHLPGSPRGTEAADFDGDGVTDLTIWRPPTGDWYIRTSSSGFTNSRVVQWGLPGDVPLSGDFDGDGKIDMTVWRPSNGLWYICFSSLNYNCGSPGVVQWGLPGDVPLIADFDGDGRSDITVWRPSEGNWYILFSSASWSAAAATTVQWGLPGDQPLAGDFDGDGKTDFTVWRPSNGTWYIRFSSLGYSAANPGVVQWGMPGDIPIIADYDGDGRAELTIFRPSIGGWFIRYSSQAYAGSRFLQWGLPGDVPIAPDFDKDGCADIAVYRPSTGTWYILQSSTNVTAAAVYQWGTGTDVPIFGRR
ncbi:MAG TPA: phospholipase D-like domain-containing protein [Vicinamibacterales bacterium]